MDEFSRVRDLASDTKVGEDAVATARRRLLAQIADTKNSAADRPAARVPHTPGRPRRGMPVGALAAVAAVVVVAIIAAGAVLVAQWMPRPAPVTNEETGTIDLGRPLLDQLEPGQYLRISTISESAKQYEGEGTQFSRDSYVVERTVSSVYLANDARWISVSGEGPPEVVRTVGPDGEAMAALVATDEPPFIYEADTPSADWLAGLPGDGDGLLAALAERQGSGPPTDLENAAQQFWGMYLSDPVWYAFTAAQREAVLERISESEDTDLVTKPDGTVEMSGFAGNMTVVLDDVAFLPISGTATGGLFGPVADGSDDLAARYTAEMSIVDEAPQVIVPDDPATFSCNGTPIPGSLFYYDELSETLDGDGRAAIAGDGVPALAADEWYAIAQSPEQVVLWSWVLHGEHRTDGAVPAGMSGGVTHELMTITRAGDSWALSDWETCVMTQLTPDHDIADVELDPAFPVTASSTELHFLVTETRCSGDPLADRIDVVDLQEHPGEGVDVFLAVRPGTSEALCTERQTAPYTVALDEPIGDGFIRDLTYMEERLLRSPQG